jgi:methyl-accepting chemotaxis protein
MRLEKIVVKNLIALFALSIVVFAVDCYISSAFPGARLAAAIGGMVILACLFLATLVRIKTFAANREYWYEQLLDNMHQPISVTDMDMRWTFINKPVEDFLKVKREDMLGKSCDTWGAKICNTPDCGVQCLRSGKCETKFEQGGGSFQVNSSYLYDTTGHKIGHIEVVTDVSSQSRLKKMLQTAASLSDEVEMSSRKLATSSNTIGQSTHTILQTISEIYGALAGTAQGSERLAAGSDYLVKNAASATEAMSQLKMAIQEVIAGNSKQQQKVTDAAAVADDGGNAISLAISNMESVNRQVDISSQTVKELGEKQSQIASIVQTIGDISEQTNLLALNAAIEAARAGEHGRGFAVVAEEVRKLAERANHATKEIGSLINGVSSGVNEAISAMEASSREVKVSVEHGGVASQALVGILDSIRSVKEAAGLIDQYVNGMTRNVDTVLDTISQVATLSRETADASADLSAKTEELTASAAEVEAQVTSQVHSVEATNEMARSLSQSASDVSELIEQFQQVEGFQKSDSELKRAA